MEVMASKTIAELVVDNYKAADVFKKYGIDFCCGGEASLFEVCRKKSLDYEKIEAELNALDQQVARSHDFKNWELDFSIDYIIQTHHSYVLESIPIIFQYAEKVARVHGHHYKETIEIKEAFQLVAAELRAHLQKEEMVLFPFIKSMAKAKKNGLPMPNPPFGTVQNPIRMMKMEHENAGDIFKKIALLSNNYQPPEGACNTFRVLYAKLREFEADLHQHIHLENNILFPKALGLEQ